MSGATTGGAVGDETSAVTLAWGSAMIGELFDPDANLAIDHHYRPHWSQAGAIVFVTFRTKDSIPRSVIARWQREKIDWLARAGVEPAGDISAAVERLSSDAATSFRKQFNRQRELYLDECHGECLLKQPKIWKLVADALLHFDRDRYHMGDFVVMPNHVHLLASFATQERMRMQFGSWLHWTARQINRALDRRGRFWQQEPFDHLVRSSVQYEYLREYIRDNPMKARLSPGEYHYYRCR